MPYTLDDTIVAIATAPGAAGLAVVRLSGSRALALADRVFRGARPLAEADGHTLHHGWVVMADEPSPPDAATAAPSRPLDEVVAAVFRAPRSYTREDVVEMSCHGGTMSAERVVGALLETGARMARPGEFTLRAFLGGRLDLAQSEAVADVIHAETRAAHDLALAQLAGALSVRLGGLSDRLADLLGEVEARVDFAEDVGGVEVPPRVIEAIDGCARELQDLLAGAAFARAVREGVPVPLVGRPNVGKSSLFNALLGEERAIVNEAPGTTRDRVSEAREIAGVRVTLSDTAGLREASEVVEAIGVARTRAALEDSPLVLWVVDGAVALDADDRAIASALAGKQVIVALNKGDLPAVTTAASVRALMEAVDGALPGGRERTPSAHAPSLEVVGVSALRGDGLDALREAIANVLRGGDADGLGGGLAVAVANPRHVEALGRGHAALARAVDAGRVSAPGEIVALELREGLGAIGEVTGRDVAEDLLERIFEKFCIGK